MSKIVTARAQANSFHDNPENLCSTISVSTRWEVLGQLLELNHAQYEEVRRNRKKGSRKGAKLVKKTIIKKLGAPGGLARGYDPNVTTGAGG